MKRATRRIVNWVVIVRGRRQIHIPRPHQIHAVYIKIRECPCKFFSHLFFHTDTALLRPRCSKIGRKRIHLRAGIPLQCRGKIQVTQTPHSDSSPLLSRFFLGTATARSAVTRILRQAPPLKIWQLGTSIEGKLDLAVVVNAGVSILLGHGNGSFSKHVDYVTQSGGPDEGIVAGDFNNDGKD